MILQLQQQELNKVLAAFDAVVKVDGNVYAKGSMTFTTVDARIYMERRNKVMGKIAVLFSGQGAQYVGMGKDFTIQILMQRNYMIWGSRSPGNS